MSSLEFRMPDVGEGIAEAEIIRWLVEVDEEVQEDQPLCAVETDKSLVEIPSPIAGTITERRAEVGDVVAVGSVLVVIGVGALTPSATQDAPPLADAAGPHPVDVDLPASSPTASHARPVPPPTSTTASPAAPRATTATAQTPRPKASPRVRRMADQRGVDLSTISGTGPHGRILEADLDRAGQESSTDAGQSGVSEPIQDPEGTGQPAHTAAKDTAPRVVRGGEPRADEVIALRGLRRTIARSMTTALTIPHVTEFREVDATNLLAAHRTLRASLGARGIRLSLLPLMLQAVIRALQLQPSMNATFDAEAETVTRYGSVHLGMATATDDGLIVPVIHHAEQLGLAGLAMEVDRLAAAARARTALSEELSGGTFTVTNFGSFGTWLGNPVIRPPEVGIAGFGRISERVIAVEGLPVVRPVLPIVVATDHRIHDGSHLADFVTAVAQVVADPILLLASGEDKTWS